MSLSIARCLSRSSIVHAVAVPCFLIAAALAAKCGGDASAAKADVANGGAAPAAAVANGGSYSASSIDPKKFCASLLPKIQALITLPLTVISADDSHTDDMHAGDDGYVSCVNGNGGYRATVIVSDDPAKAFTSALKKGYDALPGFGDVARSSHGGITWVDVMKARHSARRSSRSMTRMSSAATGSRQAGKCAWQRSRFDDARRAHTNRVRPTTR